MSYDPHLTPPRESPGPSESFSHWLSCHSLIFSIRLWTSGHFAFRGFRGLPSQTSVRSSSGPTKTLYDLLLPLGFREIFILGNAFSSCAESVAAWRPYTRHDLQCSM